MSTAQSKVSTAWTGQKVHRIKVIDTHTAGEPTRVVIEGFPDLGDGPIAQRKAILASRYDHYRRAIITEPHGTDAMVGAVLLEPADPTCAAGVVFFNNVGYLGMCGHGTIGLVKTLHHIGHIEPGQYRIETPVGVVTATLHPDGQVTVVNVPSYRATKGMTVHVPGIGEIHGDVAWGGNWFFFSPADQHDLSVENIKVLIDITRKIRKSLQARGLQYVDHIALIGRPKAPGANARSFVLCPGNSYDRSPCGTGLSAYLACLAADGRLAEGCKWVQEGILGTRFVGTYQWLDNGHILPSITGSAYITAEATLVLDELDPFCWGIGP